MSYIDEFEDFVNEELNEESEKEFAERFANEFANNESYRYKIKRYLQLTSLLSASFPLITTPPELKADFFKKIGYKLPNNEKESKPDFFRSRFFTGIATSIVSIICTIAFLKFIDSNSNNKIIYANEAINTRTNNDIKAENNQISKETQDNTKIQKTNLHKNAFNSARQINSQEESFPIEYKQIENEKLGEKPTLIRQTNLNQIKPTLNLNNRSNQIALLETPHIESQFKIENIVNEGLFDKLNFEFKNTPALFTNEQLAQPSKVNSYNNTNLSVIYQIDESISLGIDARQETFYVKYNSETDNELYTYYQQPNIFSVNILARYIPFKITERIQPYLQLQIGGSKYGLITREMLGVKACLYENIYLLAGFENNQLIFKHLGKTFITNKSNINYGIGINLK